MEGLSNYILGIAILGLKLFLLPRCWPLLMFMLYIGASIFTSITFLSGWSALDPAATLAVSILGVLCAMECTFCVAGLRSIHEQHAILKWCFSVGALLCASLWLASPEIYPNYSTGAYLARLYCGVFTTGWLVALLGYSFTIQQGVRIGLVHGAILLARVSAITGTLLVLDQDHWYLANNLGGVVNLLTLAAWIWINPARAFSARGSRNPGPPSRNLAFPSGDQAS